MSNHFRGNLVESWRHLPPPIENIRIGNIVDFTSLLINSDDVDDRITTGPVQAPCQLACFVLLRPAPLALDEVVLNQLASTNPVDSGYYSGL